MLSLVAKNPRVEVGQTFTRLTVIGAPFRCRDSKGVTFQCVVCKCECGKCKVYRVNDLLRGTTTSCRCRHREISKTENTRHGLYYHPLYPVWRAMLQRCDPNASNSKWHGQRGITVCEEWKSFEAFYAWAIKSGWKPRMTIDRYPDRDGNYEPSNCRIATFKENANNKDCNRWLTVFGETKTMIEWSEDDRCMVAYGTLNRRMQYGWDAHRAITTPPTRKATRHR